MPEQPFRDPLRFGADVEPCAIVIFGANGDLTMRMLLPALYSLANERKLPPNYFILGNSRSELSDEDFRGKMREAVQKFSKDPPFDEEVWSDFGRRLYYLSGNLKEDKLYGDLSKRLEELTEEHGTGGNILFYLSTQPSFYGRIVKGLGASGLAEGEGWRRLVVEKPFGEDLKTAKQLSDEIHEVFPEEDVYRIDHYLGKETVQNILAFRFGNGIFEPLWNRRYVNHVQITGAESIGVEGRGSYYQEAGALRDMIQNHLLQVMATVGMEPAAEYNAELVRDERAKFLRSIRTWKPEEVAQNAVAGQYGSARVGADHLPGFREEEGVDPNSNAETYAALTLFVDNWRWAGVPFYVRSGKRLAKRVTEISIHFNRAPHPVFDQLQNAGQFATQPNLLTLRIQPQEGISLRFLSKLPGEGMHLRPVSMDFSYGTSFGVRVPSAYETLLLDALEGDPTLYTRQDMVEASWRVVQSVLDVWKKNQFDFPNYEAGSWGPEAAEKMLARHGHSWRIP